MSALSRIRFPAPRLAAPIIARPTCSGEAGIKWRAVQSLLVGGALPDRTGSFEELVLPHARAAWNLARWLLRNDHDAEDVVQEAIVRALRFFDGFRGDNPRAWLLAVVRNSAYSFLQRNRARELGTPFDEDLHAEPVAITPEVLLLRSVQKRSLDQAVEALPVEFREVFVLRELEGLSYKEIAEVARIPIGTVMSRLSRARRQLQSALGRRETGSAS
jgi:RNA polymerase sigma-70 factor (ECF subfamily)